METNFKVDRNGIVKIDGNVVGYVERTTDGTSMVSAISGNAGPVKWIPRGTDRNALAGCQSTRREAARIVAEYAAPITVKGMELKSTYYRAPLDQVWSASLTFQGTRMLVSRGPLESAWHIDSLTPRGAFFPTFHHGTGSRPGEVLIHVECIAALNKALESEIARIAESSTEVMK